MNALAIHEQEKLEILEAKIAAGLQTFVEVGTALLEIRDSRLYRQWHGTFEDYCRERWGMSRSYAHRTIEAAQVASNLLPVGNIPINERQVRPLARLEPEIQPIAWGEAVATAPNGKVTAAHVEATVRRFVEPVAPDEDEEYLDEVAGEESSYDWTEEEPPIAAMPYKNGATAHNNHAISDTPGYDGDEWYTPLQIVESARRVLREIDLDPATCLAAQEQIQAKNFYTKDDDSLRDGCEWFGRVWLNPPYSMPLIKQFVTKLIHQFDAGNVTEAIIITNNSSDTSWFHMLLERFPACFTFGRTPFWRPNHDNFGTRQGQTIFYLGDNVQTFCHEFAEIGRVVIAL